MSAPIDMVLHCPACGVQHVDTDNSDEVRIEAAELGFIHGSRDWEHFVEAKEWTNPPHKSHLCHGCKHVWRPADVPTNGVQAVKTIGASDSPVAASAARDVARYRWLRAVGNDVCILMPDPPDDQWVPHTEQLDGAIDRAIKTGSES